MKKIGIAGLGTMGFAIASNLLNKGYEVYGYDINPARTELLKNKGGHAAESCADLGGKVDTVITMVFSPDNLRDTLLGKNGLIETFPQGGTIVVTASMGPKIIAEVEPALARKGVKILDAPVMADFNDAEAGRMHVIVSGEPSLIEGKKELLNDMSSELYIVGDKPGMAQAGKMCLQDLFCLTFEAGYETITLARKYDLNISEMLRLFRDSPASSVMLGMAADYGLKREFRDTYSPMSILNKDVHIAVDMARDVNIPVPASEGTAGVFQKAYDRWPDEDVWSGIKIIENDPI
ncbi:MAG: NAD(P)-dependent oxidoreductase [Clostridium sp.]|nr:NAD(P)-dependent oxidoreductase [Clostridium sp.]